MLLEKPAAVTHVNSSGNACAIYGIDAHPTSQLLATAGGDNTVKIWSLAPQDDGLATFELVATLAFHQQAVNCVRWAGHGRYLASGSDDQFVLLYELQAGAPAPVPFGSNAKPNLQNWVRCSTLKRHTMDVQDVAWSPDDRMLATCSIDNTILIWDVGVTGVAAVMSQPLQTLTGHSGWVKGVAWDPVGKYLSSAGEDKTVRIWRVDNWKEAHVVTEPFESCASTSHFRRLSWSPDGSALCATHAFKSKKNIGALLDRTTWSNDVKFVGHQGVVTSARFNPRLLATQDAPDKEFACCAVGGDDATVSIWLAHLARPLAVIKDCFDASVTDLSWSSNESILLASSLDGTICCFKFDGGEIGRPIAAAQQSKLLQSKYGSRAGITLASTLAENPIQLQLEAKSAPTRAKATTMKPLTAPTVSTTTTLIPKKKHPKGGAAGQNGAQSLPPSKSSKKRIAPVLMQAQNNAASSDNNIHNILAPTVEESTLLETRMTKEPEQASDGTKAPSSLTNGDANGTTTIGDAVTISTFTVKPVEPKKTNEVSLKRKRDQERSTVSSTVATPSITKAREVVPRPPKVLANSDGQLLPEFPFRLSFTVETGPGETPTGRGPLGSASGNASGPVIIEVTVHNMKNPQAEEIIALGPVYSTVKCTQTGVSKWMDRFPGRAVCAVGNSVFFAIGMDNGDLYILSQSGRRLFPCIALGGRFSVMECSLQESPFLLVVLASGALKIWHVLSRKQVLSDTIETITSRDPVEPSHRLTLLRCQVTTKGQPIITFAKSNPEIQGHSSLQSFTFDSDMHSWMRVADESFVFSDFNSSLPTDALQVKDIPIGPLRRLQNASGYSRTQRGIAAAMLSGISDPLLQRNVTRSHLEHQMAASIVLKSSREYQYWIQAYVKFLVQDEDVARLHALCSELMGPYHASSGSTSSPKNAGTAPQEDGWNPMILTLRSRDVLKTQVLPTIASNRTLQRVVTKYELMLREIDAREREE